MQKVDVARVEVAAPPGLSQRRIAVFWLPLAASWLMMTLESPITSGTLARLPDPALMLAAFGISLSLSILIESPIIMLLSTSTALGRDRQSYAILRRFALGLIALTTLMQFAVAFTPLFDVVVRQAMGVPKAIADAAQPGLQIMLFWSGAVAWRRFKQGFLIRYGHTRLIGSGTVVRLIATAATAIGLAVWGRATGVEVAAWALLIGVVSETIYAQFVAAPVIAQLPQASPASGPGTDLTYRGILRYHLPLAATTLLLLVAQPLVGAALARSPHPELALAAWPIVHGLLLLFRSPAIALPEASIALLNEPGAWDPVRRFCITVGLAASTGFGLVVFTPLAGLYISGVLGISPELAEAAIPGLRMALLVPLLLGMQGWMRGRLMHMRVTPPITLAMGLNLFTMITVLVTGVALRVPGVPLAGIALTLAMTVECLVLFWSSSRIVR